MMTSRSSERPASERASALSRSSLFLGQTVDDLLPIAERCREREYAKGQLVWHAGDPGEELLLVEAGELSVWRTDKEGGEELIARLGAGECVGEMALLVDDWRSATVTCTRAALVLALTREDFRLVIEDDPAAMTRVSQVVAQRAAAMARRERVFRGTTVVAVVAEPGTRGGSLLAASVAAMQGQLLGRTVTLVRIESADKAAVAESTDGEFSPHARAIHEVIDRTASAEEFLQRVQERVGTLTGKVPVVVVDASAYEDLAIASASAFADVVIAIVSTLETAIVVADPHTVLLRVLNAYNGVETHIPIVACEPFVLPADRSLEHRPIRQQIKYLLERPQQPISVVIRRLAHKALGVSVGVAFGGGAALGIAHIGVLEVFEQAGISIDLTAGASMGSIIAIGYAAGLTPTEMVRIVDRLGTVTTTLSAIDPTLAGTGLLKGRRLRKILGPSLPDGVETFDHLVRPCQVLATDIETGERVCLDSGSLETAVRASCSVPLVFTPERRDGRTLVDGAFVDPVPADVVREMGADIVVGVNVLPPLKKESPDVITRAFRGLNRLNPFAYLHGTERDSNFVDIFVNTLQIVWSELGSYKLTSADVGFTVDVADFSWIEFYRGRELIERGRHAAEKALPQLQAVLHAHLEGYAAVSG
jgi:NTE family protein